MKDTFIQTVFDSNLKQLAKSNGLDEQAYNERVLKTAKIAMEDNVREATEAKLNQAQEDFAELEFEKQTVERELQEAQKKVEEVAEEQRVEKEKTELRFAQVEKEKNEYIAQVKMQLELANAENDAAKMAAFEEEITRRVKVEQEKVVAEEKAKVDTFVEKQKKIIDE